MNSLEDAWRWYESVRDALVLMSRLAGRYWKELPWEGSLGRDNRLATVNPDVLHGDSAFGLHHLDDLAVLVLFSVFESIVRDEVLRQLELDAAKVTHPVLVHAIREARQAVQDGSFFRVLEPFKSGGHADLVERVNQVRRYRNWVAHGRREGPPDNVDPTAAYERLRQFLSVLATTG